MLFRRFRNGGPERIEEEIQDLIDHVAEQGRITPDEGEMIQSIFEFGDTVAREIMVPRTSIIAVPSDASLGQLIDSVIENGHTRLPVYDGDIDHIQGVLIAKDLLAHWGRNREDPMPRELVRPPIFVPESKKIVDLFKELRTKKSHMAIVLDEYGGTSGLLTLEDILEEIVGDIHDEYDVDEETITRLDDDTILVDARVTIEELSEYLGQDLPEGDYETLGGFITDLTGRVPTENEQVQYKDLLLTIRSADERKINQVEIQTHSPAGRHSSPSA
jgi:magnesium and cobalt transporter